MKQESKTVHIAALLDICHLNNSELEPKFQRHKGRVVLRSDIEKDDSGSYAVFTERGSSASQMKAAKVMDIITRLPGCAGQVVDAVSDCTQVQMEDAPSFSKNPKSECARVENFTKWVQMRCAQRMMRVVISAIRLGPKTSECEMNVTVVSSVTGCDVTTVQQHYKGSTSKPPRFARLCQIREASLVALRKI